MQNHFNTEYFNSKEIQNIIINALKEDIGSGDHTSLACIPSAAKGKAKLLVKDEGVICGLPLAEKIFLMVDQTLELEFFIKDGAKIKSRDVAFHVYGSSQSILTAERLVLNFLQRLSGIATYTASLVEKLKHTQVKLLDTRKTTPGLRMLEKYAVKTGGGFNHRFGLYDMVMIKDNHIDFSGGIEKAISKAHQYLQANQLNLKIEIEARNLEAVQEILDVGKVDRIMLDNFKPSDIKTALKLINKKYETEASGGINEENLVEYAETGVDFISIGAFTHQIKSLDLSLKAF